MAIETMENRELTTADLAKTANREVAANPDRTANDGGPLVPQDFADDLRHQWEQVQTGFVDDPRSAVKRADELVASAIKKLAETFAVEREKLESQWSSGNDVSTEDLRVALQRYRSFFQRLITI